MAFTLWPAIDLKGGKCVRLLHGDMATAKTYGDDPAAQARRFADAGFRALHVVDLDGAFSGTPENAGAVEAILQETEVPVQLGGGIRSLDAVERWLSLGVTRVILGTMAIKDEATTRAALAAFKGRIVLGLDAREGRVATDGWGEQSTLLAADVIGRYDKNAIAAIVYTDIARDGALSGVNGEETAALARQTGLPVVASGGVASMDDIRDLIGRQTDGVAGAILGRSLYEKTIVPADALSLTGEVPC